jgi:diaminopimelate decarboxylase
MTDLPDQTFDTEFMASLARKFGTPLYVFDWRRILQNREALRALTSGLPARNWLSMKTAPLRPLVSAWKEIEGRIEVVSEFELSAAVSVGYRPENILVNGPGKIGWLHRVELRGLKVIFDSLRECQQLGLLAKNLGWTVGLRIAPSVQTDPDDEAYAGQFGLGLEQLGSAVEHLRVNGVGIGGVQFHLRSNVSHVNDYRVALREVLSAIDAVSLSIRFIDCGGGLPSRGEVLRSTGRPTWSEEFDKFGEIVSSETKLRPDIQEIWLENGRFLLADAGWLILGVIDVKARADANYVICDGGRITNAFPSDWEKHDLTVVPSRRSMPTNYSICGPTCMAYDWLERGSMELDIRPGDYVIWHNAGAYHLPWETRFSFGHAAVVWVDGNGKPTLARKREQFQQWWGVWE